MKKLIVHLGLHKTGTSFLQQTFLANRDALREAGVWMMPTRKFRRNFTGELLREKSAAEASIEEGRAYFEDILREHDVALISDENLLGPMYKFDQGLPYPNGGKYVGLIEQMVPAGCELKFFLSIRNHADWLESVYLQALKSEKYIMGFDEFISRADFKKASWLPLLREIRAAAPTRSLTVWSYEFFVRNNDAVIRLFGTEAGVNLPERTDVVTKPSFSAVAQQLLIAAKNAGVRDEDWKAVYQLIRGNFTSKNKYGKPVLLDATTRERLAQAYAQDLNSMTSSTEFSIPFPLGEKTTAKPASVNS